MTKYNRRVVSVLAIIAVSLLVFVSITVSAEPPFMRGGHASMWRMERLAHSLDLDPQQREQLEQLEETARKSIRPRVRELVSGRQELRKLIQADAFDETAVRQLATRQSAAMTEMMVEHARQRYRVRQLLTPTQREKFDRHADRRAGRHD